METLRILEAQRQLIITAMYVGNTWEELALMEGYETDCRAAGIDPDSWEGLR